MYSSDNDQLSVMSGSFSTAGKAMWPAPGGLNTANSGAAWTVEIYPYVKNIGIFSDPSQADTYVDYMFNVQSASCGYLPPTYTVQDSWTPSGSNLGQCYYPLVWIPNPATKIEFICGSYGGSPGNWMGSWPEITMAGGFLGGFNTPANPITRVTPHNGGANIAYFDGHVGFGTPQGIGIIQVANTGAWYPTATS
jgi:prepilin-type processing-associated H-X9-DG protein